MAIQKDSKTGRFIGSSKVKIQCRGCDIEFETFGYRAKTAKYCSRKCKDEHQKTLLLGSNNPQYKNGTMKMALGYLVNSQTKVGIHREIMEKFLGRKLNSKEVVHHTNGIRNDNRIENLILFGNQSEHMKFERRVQI